MNGRHILLAALLVGIGGVLASCGGKSKPTQPEIDTTAPTVVSTSPVDAAGIVWVNASVSATFSEAISPASLTTGTFTLAIDPGSMARVAPARSATGVVPGTVSLSPNGKVATFTPTGGLALNRKYDATLTTGIKDVAGNALAQAKTWTFTTSATGVLTAYAGPDQDVTPSAVVKLDGSGSYDPEGQALTYDWTQVGGADVTGGSGHLAGVHPQFTAPTSSDLLEFNLTVSHPDSVSEACHTHVWVLRGGAGIFVSANGNDVNTGALSAPKRTIAAAISAAVGSGIDVYIQAGTYTGSVDLAGGVSLYGGFSTGPTHAWCRMPGIETVILGGPTAVTGGIGATDLKLSRLVIRSADASAPGASSIGVLLHQSQRITIDQCAINAGRGAGGAAGTPGIKGSDGQEGHTGEFASCGNATQVALGGTGGNRQLPLRDGAGGNGGDGGTFSAYAGAAGTDGFGLRAGTGGLGGLEISAPDGLAGTAGTSGASGADGARGSGIGSLGLSGYVPSNGGPGASGERGGGGGGGGGSSGHTSRFVCLSASPGNGGGGGGGAGYSGSPGGPGLGGGASFAVVLYATNTINITLCALATAGGGKGGNGGLGGDGGAGGAGGLPGKDPCDCGTFTSGVGGPGGAGGNGGRGGGGGGGGGGPSICILEDASAQGTLLGTNTQGAGPGGPGGTCPTGNLAARGQDGRCQNYYKMP
jgi:hypothetical protein